MGARPGFCGLKTTAAAANPPMTTDPNADLVGYALPVDTGGVGVVTGTARWNPLYVVLDTPAGATVRVAAQVRRRRELRND